ncbi:MAG: dienelactone hydrolase family protein, partial [Methylobacteriaceae bacterium]|nr:dienelactone hydrolase family protein [Methylobacteriaceae bacterium]
MKTATHGLVLSAVLVGLAFLIAPAEAQDLVREDLRIPMEAAAPQGLEALLVKPVGPGRRPLALINHAATRGTEDLSQLTARQMLPELEVFARRGWAAVTVMRRGYGSSGGMWAESYGPCTSPDYLSSISEAAADLRAAVAALSTRPDIDASRIISVGASSGGFATVALTADPPPGLVAGISFAGARGSPSSDHVCNPDALVATFKSLGERSRVPMLWVFAENDHFFSPALAERMRQAFVAGGGNVTFVETPAFGDDGHFLFSPAGMPIWAPIVDRFLEKAGLKLLANPLPSPPAPALAPPPGLGAQGVQAFRQYLEGAPHKAFAVASDGSFGWRTARRTEQEARRDAMDNCGNNGATDCRVVAVDNAM